MQAEFWHERWEKNEIGFHQAAAHPALDAHFAKLALPAGSTVLVPLCGKSLDMIWLANAGHRVLGVELSPIACRAFFEENGIAFAEHVDARQHVFAGGPYRIVCGDFFALTATDLTQVRAVYDRAALIALPPEMRQRYATMLKQRLPAAAQQLLVTFDYDQSKMPGPPHAVSQDEVHALYDDRFSVTVLHDTGRATPPPPLQARGLEWIAECTLLLAPKR